MGIDYRQEVARMDRLRAWMMRAGIAAAAIVLGELVLWNAGITPQILQTAWNRFWSNESLPVIPSAPPAIHPTTLPTNVGAAPAVPEDSALKSSLSEVSLSLVLVSTVTGRHSREGTARLGPDASNPQTYMAGALLENGTRLTEIYVDHVVLERGGERIELYIGGKTVVASRGASTTSLSAATDLLNVGGRKSAVITHPSSIDMVSEVIRAQPVFDGGKLSGLQVYPGRSSYRFEQLGLKAGDIVQFVDGKRISTDSQWNNNVVQALINRATVNVSVTRDGQLVHLSLNGESLIDGHFSGAAAANLPSPTGP